MSTLSQQRLQALAVLWAVLLQVGLLAAWSAQQPWLFVAVVGALAVPVWAMAKGVDGAQNPVVAQVALGGLGMLLGAWADAHFATPHCLCCTWGPSASFVSAAWAALQTWSALGMSLGCWVAMVGFARSRTTRRRGTPYQRALPALVCCGEFLSMWLGMLLTLQACSGLLRLLPLGKLAVGHAAMLWGMALGLTVFRTRRTRGNSPCEAPHGS